MALFEYKKYINIDHGLSHGFYKKFMLATCLPMMILFCSTMPMKYMGHTLNSHGYWMFHVILAGLILIIFVLILCWLLMTLYLYLYDR